MKRASGLVIIFIALIAAILDVPHCVAADPDNTVHYKVGVVLPLTGATMSIGAAIKNGIMLAYEDLDPSLRSRLELVFEDDASQSASSVSALQKLTAVNKIDVLISALSNACSALVPITERQELPFIVIAFDPSMTRNKRYAVNLWVKGEDLAQLAVKEALRRGYQNIAVVSTLHEGNLAMKKLFLEANKSQLKIVYDEEILPTERDFKQSLAKLRTVARVDAVANFLLPSQAGLFARQARDQEIKLPSFALGNYEDLALVRDSDGALIGQWYVGADDPEGQFIAKYKQRFPNDSMYGAANGYDALLLIGEALKQNTPPKEVAAFFHNVKDFKGAQGLFSANGDNRFTMRPVVKVLTKDGYEVMK
jgi:branched-chain amino acid transport system substrate-binding protein